MGGVLLKIGLTHATLRGEKHDISLKILHQEGFEPARQAATLAKPCPSL